MTMPSISNRLVSRREAILSAGAGCAAWTICGGISPKLLAADKPAGAALVPLNRFPRMVQEYLVQQIRQAERAAEETRNGLKTKADAERYVADVREKIRASFGPFPEKTPLGARVTGVVERDAYKIEKVIFESRPGFLVTANLYVPKGREFPLPGVVGVCGHYDNGKAAEECQSFCQGLVRMGHVVLIIDPIGQGERLQYSDLHDRKGRSVAEHLRAGNQQVLVGEFFGAWRAWDGVRALDYLLSRPEVDPRHVGVTGNSGGGTMTTLLCGIEQRWTMAAPCCFITTFRRNAENELPADPEQYPPRGIALGLDHSDFLAAMAPEPIIILAKEKDYFDIRGAKEAFTRLNRLYRLLGAEENIGLFVGPSGHGYTQENREAMYRWFNRATGVSQATAEPKLAIEKDETLWCTPHGQVAELDSRSLFSFTRARSQELSRSRRPISAPDLQRAVAEVLKLPPERSTPEYRILRPVGGRKYPEPKKYCTSYPVETEPGGFALVHLLTQEDHVSRPPQGIPRAVLYVAHQSSDAEIRGEPLVTELLQAEPKAAFYACDVRGIGESQPNTCGRGGLLDPYGADYFYAGHGLMLDKPYVGQRTHDLLQVLEWLKLQGHREVHLAGKGWGTLPATFAALLSPLVVQVTLKNALRSYADVAESEKYDWPLSALVPEVLMRFDLPDCYQALEAKHLRQIETWGPTTSAPK